MSKLVVSHVSTTPLAVLEVVQLLKNPPEYGVSTLPDIHLQKCAKVQMVKQLQMHGVRKVLLLLKAFTIPLHLFWIEDLGLTLADKEILVNGKWLTDNLINAGQRASIC